MPPNYLPWVQMSRLVAQIGFYSSTFFCYIFIMITMLSMKKRFGSYSYLLMIFSALGILFASFEFVLYPNVHSYNAGYLFYSTCRPFNFSKDDVTFIITMYTGVYASTISMLSVQFIYRYWAIFYKEKLRMFKGPWVTLWIFYCLYFGIQWALGIHFLDKIDGFAIDYLRSPMKENYDLDIDFLSGVAVVMYSSDNSLRYRNLAGLANMSLIMMVQYTVISYCAIMMYQHMEEKLQLLSAARRKLHKQFFKTLILQIFTPSLCLFLPVIAIIYLPLLSLQVNLPTGVVLCAITLYPAMDSIIIMIIVTDYRKAMRRYLRKTTEALYDWIQSSDDQEGETTQNKLD